MKPLNMDSVKKSTAKTIPISGAIAAVPLLFFACSPNSPGPSEAEMTGIWNATRIEYVSKSTSEVIDMFTLGGTMTLNLGEDDSFEFVTDPPDQDASTLTGTWEMDGDLLRLLPTPGGVVAFDASLSGEKLILTGADAAYDFDDDGGADPAKLNLELTRNE